KRCFKYWYSKKISLPDLKSKVVIIPPMKEWLSKRSDILAFKLIPKPRKGSTTNEVFKLLAMNCGTYCLGPVTLLTRLCFLKATKKLSPPGTLATLGLGVTGGMVSKT